MLNISCIKKLVPLMADLSQIILDIASVLKEANLDVIEAQNVVVETKELPDKQAVKRNADSNAEKIDVTLEMIRGVLAEKSQAGHTGKVKELLEQFGAAKLSAVKPENYDELYKAASAIK